MHHALVICIDSFSSANLLLCKRPSIAKVDAASRREPPQPKTNNFGFWHVINLLDRKRLEKGSQGSKSGFVLSDFAKFFIRFAKESYEKAFS